MSARGVNPADSRNAAVLAFLQPPDFSDPDVVRPRLSATMGHAPPDKIDAAVAKIMAAPNPPVPMGRPAEAITHPRYGGLGTHPDLIDQLWHLDAALPQSSRYVVYGFPALVHPVTGVVFGFAQGTLGYALRLPPGPRAEADRQRAEAVKPSGPSPWDVSGAGPEWRAGTWAESEKAWCRAAFDEAGLEHPGPGPQP